MAGSCYGLAFLYFLLLFMRRVTTIRIDFPAVQCKQYNLTSQLL